MVAAAAVPEVEEASMERLGGLSGSYSDGVFFTEQSVDKKRHVRHMLVTVEIDPREATHRELRTRLAKKVTAAGGNALVSFSYSKTTTMLSWGQGMWKGTGYIARL